MKSQLSDLLKIWCAASLDAAHLCATSLSEHARDCERVRMNIETRGLGFLVLDLPSLDTLLTTLLEDGSVRFEGPLTGRRSKTDSRPRFLWSHWERVCDDKGCLLSEPDVDSIAALRQLSCFFKKLEVQCSSTRIENAIKDYYAIESNITPARLNWLADHIDLNTSTTFASGFEFVYEEGLFNRPDPRERLGFERFLQRLDKVAGILVSELGVFDSMSEDSRETGFFKHGPGAVSNRRASEYKYAFPYWSDKLEGLFPFDWCSGATLGAYPPSKVEKPSALLTVPKTAKAPRLIAAEPVEHQWCQQKVKTWLDYAMKHSLVGRFFDPSNQALSQALVASASHNQLLSTLDLSSASDRVSCRHVEALFNANKTLLAAVHATRTRWIEDRVTTRDKLALRKFASMGSALTFPVQSIFFLSVALASAGAQCKRSIKRLVGKVRVFGDDIILPSYAYNDCVKHLGDLGLKVNRNKSFSKGLFRESCGADCWGGFDVTPVKPKHVDADTPVGIQGLLDLANNLHLKGWWKAGEVVIGMLPPRFKRNVFRIGSGVPGLVSFAGERVGPLKWDSNLHRWYTPQPVVVKLQERVVQDNSFALREFLTSPYSAVRPRVTGTKRIGVAKIATSRVEPTKSVLGAL